MATSITVPIKPVKVQISLTVDRMGNVVTKVADIDAVIEKEIEMLLYRQCEIIEEIQALYAGTFQSVCAREKHKKGIYQDEKVLFLCD